MFTQAILELQSEKYLKTIDEDAVLQMEQNDKSLFVFSSFTTPAFLHCIKVWHIIWFMETWILNFTRTGETVSWRVILIFHTVCALSCSLAAEWWVHWWCCTACSSSTVSPKRRSPFITWPWLTSLFPAPAWIKQCGLVHCVWYFADWIHERGYEWLRRYLLRQHESEWCYADTNQGRGISFFYPLF